MGRTHKVGNTDIVDRVNEVGQFVQVIPYQSDYDDEYLDNPGIG